MKSEKTNSGARPGSTPKPAAAVSFSLLKAPLCRKNRSAESAPLAEQMPGVHHIELNLHDVDQTFTTMDPSPFHEKDLQDDAAEFILSWAQEFHRPGPVDLIAHLEKLPDGHNAQRLVERHPALRELLVTDTVVPQETNWPELKVVTVAPLLAGAIQRLAAHQSISDLFD